MLVSSNDRAVDHHVSIVVVSGQVPENPFDNAALAPAPQSSVDVLPIPEPDRQVAPGNTCPIAIQHGFDKQTVICSIPADMALTARKKILDPFPLIIAQTIPSHLHMSLKSREKTTQNTRKYKARADAVN
jgi:hypothetical protein